MTARPNDTPVATAAVAPDPDLATAKAKAATTREAKGSVQEAIGKLIGDDAVRERGTAEKKAGAADAPDITPSSRN